MDVLAAAASKDKAATEGNIKYELNTSCEGRKYCNGECQAEDCQSEWLHPKETVLPNGIALQNGSLNHDDVVLQGSQNGVDVASSCVNEEGIEEKQLSSGPGAASNEKEESRTEAEGELRRISLWRGGKPAKRTDAAGKETGPLEEEVDPAASERLTDENLRETERLLREHSGCSGPWRLCRSALGGRGLVAARPLLAGDTVLRDPPLLLAPRAASAPLCMRCHRRAQALTPCDRCRMPVCCQAAGEGGSEDHHAGECSLLAQWGVRPPEDGAGWPRELVRVCAALRCVALPPHGRRVVAALQAHRHPRYDDEMELLSRLASSAIPAQQLAEVHRAARVLDTNAFETPLDGSRSPDALSCRLRGLYPLGAMMNHTCSPNTTHGYDAQHAMVVRAAVDIAEGQELTTSYAPLLWGTPARRAHLADTKGFLCTCDRCADPEELGSLLSGLRCGRGGCQGTLVCLRPLETSSGWRCNRCGWQLSAGRAFAVQAALGSMLAAVDTSRPDAVAAYLRSPRVTSVLLPTNQVAVELKSCLVWLYGHVTGCSWEELSDEELDLKEGLCRELLQLLQLLKVGRCRLRGLFLYELHCTLFEKTRRRDTTATTSGDTEVLESLEEAADIFRREAMAPPDLPARLARLRASSESR